MRARGNASGGNKARDARGGPSSEPRGEPRVPSSLRAESSRHRISRAHPFASEQFHVLLNSLFKVLCNFPSRYLFAIGLTAVFSLRWSLPPNWGCTLKQPDSTEVASGLDLAAMGLAPALGYSPGQGDLLQSHLPARFLLNATFSRRPCGRGIRRWAHPCSLAVTKGIPVGFFSSAYLYA